MNTIIVIPAYNPNKRLINLVDRLAKLKDITKIIVVNDGSDRKYSNIFIEVSRYADVISYNKNKGKGYALKTGFKFIKMLELCGTVITVDADGQHSIYDIQKCLKEASNNKVVLGIRKLNKYIPIKSYIGNKIINKIFEIKTHKKLSDTQTGLRAFNTDNLDEFIKISGNRYEYELNFLMYCIKNGISIKEIKINTIYFNKNKETHFRPIIDSIKIIKTILKYENTK